MTNKQHGQMQHVKKTDINNQTLPRGVPHIKRHQKYNIQNHVKTLLTDCYVKAARNTIIFYCLISR